MKSNNYILKRIYLERNAERFYQQHLQRLNQINSQPKNISKQLGKIDDMLELMKDNHLKAKEFREVEKLRE